MTAINRDEAQQMVDSGEVKIIEVLPKDSFKDFHLPGAMNVPVGDDFEANIQKAVPDKHEPVLVYCLDEDCDASPKAAEKMEELGYDRVYDYEAGKEDWKEAGLPIED